jgi:hypothetical protein
MRKSLHHKLKGSIIFRKLSKYLNGGGDMKRLILLTLLMLGAVLGIQAQEVEFEEFSNELYGVQGLVPLGWESRGFGSYARGASADDVTAIFIQSAPLPVDTLLDALTTQLSLEEMPEAESQLEGELLWDIREAEASIQGMDFAFSIATSEVEGTTYIVLLQSLSEEHEALHETVFVPVVESVAPLVVEEDEEEVPYTVEEISFSNGDITLAGTLTTPEGDGPFPAVVLISGSGPQDRDESLAPLAAIKPFRDIADYLTRNGIAVLRYDERGVGESEGDYATATLEDFAADASAAVDYLLENGDYSAIGLIGHSEGGIIAPYLANTNENIDFVIGLAAPAVSMGELLVQQGRRVYGTMGLDEETVDAIAVQMELVFEAVMAEDDEALREAVIELIELQGGTAVDSQVDAAIAQVLGFKTIGYFDWDIEGNWSAVEQPILAIYGELDVQVDSFQNAPALEAATAENEDVTIVVFPDMNHILQTAETGGIEEYGTAPQEVMEDVLETMSDWILERF